MVRWDAEKSYFWMWYDHDNCSRLDSSIQFNSVAQSCPALCDPMDCSIEDWTEDCKILQNNTLHLLHKCPLCFVPLSVQFSSVAQSCPTLCDPMNCSTPGLPVHHQLPEFTQTHVHWVDETIQPSHPLSSPSPPAPNPSSIRVFSNESTLHMRWPTYWSFSFSISPSNEHPGLISLRMDWLDLLAVQETQRVFSNTTDQKHQFFGAQLSSQSNFHIHIWSLEKP